MKALSLFLSVVLISGASRADDYVSEPVFFFNYPEKVKGERVPDGAIGYQVVKHNDKVHWITQNSRTLPVMWWDGKPNAKNDYVRSQPIPKDVIGYSIAVSGTGGGYSIQVLWVIGDYFKDELPSFPAHASIGMQAYLQLVDEPIGPQGLDSAEFKVPELSRDWRDRLDKNRLSQAIAIFSSGEKVAPAAILRSAVHTGKCVYRVAPNTEVGAALTFINEGDERKAGVVFAVPPEEAEAKATAGEPGKYSDLEEKGLVDVLARFRAEKAEWSEVSAEVPDKRGLPKDSLYFDVSRPTFQRGYRLRSFVSPSGKTSYAVEGYATQQANSHAGRRLKFLEPVVYCVFHKSWSPKK